MQAADLAAATRSGHAAHFRRFRCSAVLFFFAVATNVWAATYDVAADFERGFLSRSNSNGVWSYGSSTSFTGPVSLYTQTLQNGSDGPNAQFWTTSGTLCSTPFLGFNNGPAYKGGNACGPDTLDIPANGVVLNPENAVADVVFTAPAAGTYSVVGSGATKLALELWRV